MADGFEIQFDANWTELSQRLATFSDKVANQISYAALRETAIFMKQEAVLYAGRSEDTHRLKVKGEYVNINPGNLKKHISFRKIRKNSKLLVHGEVGYQVYVRIKIAWYAKFVEFGRSNMAAKPFMRPAFENNVDKMIRIFKEMIDMGIRDGGFE